MRSAAQMKPRRAHVRPPGPDQWRIGRVGAVTAVALGFVLLAIRQVSAQCEAAKLLASDGAAGDLFGLVAL